MDLADGLVVAVSSSPVHGFNEVPQPSIRLLAGVGVEGRSWPSGTRWWP